MPPAHEMRIIATQWTSKRSISQLSGIVGPEIS
jgi:hypothetical protein